MRYKTDKNNRDNIRLARDALPYSPPIPITDKNN